MRPSTFQVCLPKRPSEEVVVADILIPSLAWDANTLQQNFMEEEANLIQSI